MELKWLEDFIALVKVQNFSRAADERNVTQPAFSRRIRALEEWLGVGLFDRTAMPIDLTPAGRTFLPHARKLVNGTESIREDLRQKFGSKRSSIRIITSHRLSMSIAPQMVAGFIQSYPDTMVSVIPSLQHFQEMGNYSEALLSGSADLLLSYEHEAFFFVGKNASSFDQLTIRSEKVIPVASPSYANQIGRDWAENTNLSLQYAGYPKHSFTQNIIEPLIERFEPRLNKVFESPVTGSIRSAVKAGIGVAWIPMSVIEDDIENGNLVQLPGAGLTSSIRITLLRRKDGENEQLNKFWDYMNPSH